MEKIILDRAAERLKAAFPKLEINEAKLRIYKQDEIHYYHDKFYTYEVRKDGVVKIATDYLMYICLLEESDLYYINVEDNDRLYVTEIMRINRLVRFAAFDAKTGARLRQIRNTRNLYEDKQGEYVIIHGKRIYIKQGGQAE